MPIFEIDGGVSSKNAQQFLDMAHTINAGGLVFVAGGVFDELIGVVKKVKESDVVTRLQGGHTVEL